MKLRILLAVAFVVTLLAVSLPVNVTGQTATPVVPPNAMVTLKSDATVMALPEDDSEELGKLPAGSAIPTNGRLVDSSWWQVPYPGGPNGNGWVQAGAVQPNQAAQGVPVYELEQPTPAASGTPATPAPQRDAALTLTADTTVMAWPDDNAAELGKLPSGSSVPTNGRLDDSQWWQIPYPSGPNGNGWVPAADVEPNDDAANVPIYEVIVPTPEAPTVVPTPADDCQFNAVYVTDVTIPDNTSVGAAQSFNKVWRVKNTGTCDWGAETVLNFIGGSQMSAPPQVNVPPTAPGATADIGVTMYAPSDPGVYRGIWQLENANVLFGEKVTIVIQVPGAEQPTPAPPSPATSTPVPPPTGVPQPSINFWADTDRVPAGQCTNIHWDVDQAQAVYLEHGGSTQGVPGHSSKQVCPSSDGKHYTLHVVGLDGQQHTREVQINIDQPQVSIKFWADKDKITIGTCTNVNWNVANSTRVQFNNDGQGWQDVSENGNMQVCPAYPAKYGLRVTDTSGKTHDRSVNIKTKAPPPGIPTPKPDK